MAGGKFMQMNDGVRIYYREIGDGPESVIIPVAAWTSPHFDVLAERSFRVIYYDPRGRGRSETGDLKNVSLDRATEDLETLRQKLGVEKTALIGFSGYGLEMAWYALQHPDRVTRLVQINPVPPRQEPYMAVRSEGMQSRIDPKLREQYRNARKEGKPGAELCRLLNRALAPVFTFHAERAIQQSETFCDCEAEWPDNSDKYFEAFLPSIAKLDLRSRVKDLKMPRLVIYGEKELIPLAGMKEWLENANNARLLVVPNADHTAFLDAPDIVQPAIADFLKGNWPPNAK
jgi:proline iminopeptidase